MTDHLFKPRPNLWAFLSGYWVGKGFTFREAAKRVGANTHPQSIQGLARQAGIKPPPKAAGCMNYEYTVRLTVHERGELTARAIEAGVDPEEWLRRVSSCAIVDSLYGAVTDGRFDPPAERQGGTA
jgi:hypothetical protein